MKWEELLDVQITGDYNSQVLTDIECPKCGRKIYLDTTIVLTTYPCKYQYWCSCGWSGTAHVKWSKNKEALWEKIGEMIDAEKTY